MTTGRTGNADQVIASLRALCAASGDEVDRLMQCAMDRLGAADPGRSEAEVPLAAEDRPNWNEFRKVVRENVLLTDHAEMLACALGACPNCWGTIPDCEDCGGIGHPGAFNPDPDMFARFVRPVIDRMAVAALGRGARRGPGRVRPAGSSA